MDTSTGLSKGFAFCEYLDPVVTDQVSASYYYCVLTCCYMFVLVMGKIDSNMGIFDLVVIEYI